MTTSSNKPTSALPATLLEWLTQHYPTAKNMTFKRMLQERRITIDGLPAYKLKQPLTGGCIVKVARGEMGVNAPAGRRQTAPRSGSPRPATAGRPAAPRGPRFDVVYEDAELLAVNKPAGLLTSTVPRETRPTLVAAVRDYLASADPGARVGVIHRLDRDASGLLVFSKNNDAYENLKQQFFDHSVERVYHAIVDGIPTPPKGRIECRLLELPDGRVVSTRNAMKGQLAATDYEVLRTRAGRALLRITLLTGRKHQIRAHLSERGTPIVGDPMYEKGGARPSEETRGIDASKKGRLLLVATKLCVDQPHTRKRLTFELKLPPELEKALVPAGAAK